LSRASELPRSRGCAVDDSGVRSGASYICFRRRSQTHFGRWLTRPRCTGLISVDAQLLCNLLRTNGTHLDFGRPIPVWTTLPDVPRMNAWTGAGSIFALFGNYYRHAWKRRKGSRLYKTQISIKEMGIFVLPNTYILCFLHDTALSFSWLAQSGWTSQEHGIMF
jgi:hypothetical protein